MAMRASRKTTYTAASVAIASVCILIGRFTPIMLVPLTVAAVCYFIAFQCGLGYGLISIAASLLLTFFWGSPDITMLFAALFFAPYSLAAHLMRRLAYKGKGAVIRAGVTVGLLNAALALTVFVFIRYVGEVLLGFNPLSVVDKLGGMPLGYIILAVLGSIAAVVADMFFVRTSVYLCRIIKLYPAAKKEVDKHTNEDVFGD